MSDAPRPIAAYSKTWSRRDLLRIPLLAAPLASPLAHAPGLARAAGCDITPPQTEGPFYMGGMRGVPRPTVPNDLTRVAGSSAAADGEVIWVEGQVKDQDCRPVAGARVEIWQACATGRYAHPRDGNPAQLDPNFGYFGYAIADSEGRYRFKTVKPGFYPVGGGWVRPAHIHFRVEVPQSRRLTTQMYFAGDPYQERDGILSGLPPAERERVVIPPVRDAASGENRFRFDLALAGRTQA